MNFRSRDTVSVMQQQEESFNPELIIKSLPVDATLAQQDSAIQANMPVRPKIRSTRPDTLGIPGLKENAAKTKSDAYFYPSQEISMLDTAYSHPEINGAYLGKSADVLPYLLRKDDGVAGILLVCFVLLLIVLSRGRRYFEQQIKDFFFSTREHTSSYSTETRQEMRYTLFLLFHTCLILGLFLFEYNQSTLGFSTVTIPSYGLLVIHVLICCAYFSLKYLIYFFVNWVFFDKTNRNKWFSAYALVLSLQGIVLFPLVLMKVYSNILPNSMWLLYALLLILAKLILFYKCFSIFFPKLYGFFHLIVYFCALEMIPMLGFWQALGFIGNYFIIKN